MNNNRIMVNGREIVLPGAEATPEEIKQAAGIDPNSMLVQQAPDANHLLQPGQRIKLAPGTHFADVPVFEYGAGVRREIVMMQSDYNAMRTHLFSDLSREQHAFLLATPCVTADRLRLLVREVIPSRADDLSQQSAAYLQVDRAHSIEVLERCRAAGLSLLEAHSHPFCSTGVAFSGVDTGNEDLKFPYVADRIPDIYHATMVFGSASVDAHLWDRDLQRAVCVDRLRVVGHPLQVIPTTSAGESRRPLTWRSLLLSALMHHVPPLAYGAPTQQPVTEEEALRADRQVRAFGQEGQAQIAACRVGIVGLGGLGALVAQMLAHLGCREMVFVDQDVVEHTNLNRLVGATSQDADIALPKVAAAVRTARAINPEVRITAVQGRVQSPGACGALKDCDVIFGGLDNHGARLVLNELCVRYLLPLIDMGTGIRVQEGRPLQAGGQVRMVIPGGFCLECLGGIDKERAAYDLMSPEGQERQRMRGYVQGADVPAPAVIFLNSTIASIAVQEFVNLLCGFKPDHRVLHWNAMSATAQPLDGGGRREDCVVCGAGQGLGLGDLGQEELALPAEEAPMAEEVT